MAGKFKQQQTKVVLDRPGL